MKIVNKYEKILLLVLELLVSQEFYYNANIAKEKVFDNYSIHSQSSDIPKIYKARFKSRKIEG